MKNVIYLFAAVTMFAFTACGGGDTTTEDVVPEETTTEDVVVEEVVPSDTVAAEEVDAEEVTE